MAARAIASNIFNGKDISELSESERRQVSDLSTLAAGLAGGVSGDSTAGTVAGAKAVENNRLFNANETMVLENVPENQRLRAMAIRCAQIHCTKGILEREQGSERYQQYAALEEAGKQILAQGNLSKDEQLASYAFQYGLLDPVWDWDDANWRLGNRAAGAGQVAAGAGLMAIGGATSELGIGIPVGVFGADMAYTGSKAMLSGEHEHYLSSTAYSTLTGRSASEADSVLDLASISIMPAKGVGASGNVLRAGRVADDASLLANATKSLIAVEEGLAPVKVGADSAPLRAPFVSVEAQEGSAQLARVTGSVQTRINLAKKETISTPLRKNGEPVSAGLNHIIAGHFERDIANNRSVFSISVDKLEKVLQRKVI